MCGAPANATGFIDPGMMHNALLDGLTPSTRYYYVYGDDGAWSDELTFHTPHDAQQQQRNAHFEQRFFAFGDMGQVQTDGSFNYHDADGFYPAPIVLNAMLKMHEQYSHSLVLHIGDIAYARGFVSEWDQFFDQVLPLASRVPWMTCVGNHERDWADDVALFTGHDSGGECGVSYAHRFTTVAFAKRPPSNTAVDGSFNDRPWYSFNQGLVHFTLMSTEHPFGQGSAQYSWIANDLASVNRSITPWLIFAGLRPMYIDSTNEKAPAGDQPVARMLRSSLESLLLNAQVDIALWGHHHSYQRSCHVFNETCQANSTTTATNAYTAPVHLVIGNAGAGLSQNLQDDLPPWAVVVNDEAYGFTTWHVTHTHLTMHAYRARDSALLDSFTLTRS
jgi:hypothetical protein